MTRDASRAAAERRLLELHAATCSILAHPTRLAMIEALRDGERTVSDLVRAVGTSAGNLSQHLGAMRDAGVVEARRERRYAFYRISDPRILNRVPVDARGAAGPARPGRAVGRARPPARPPRRRGPGGTGARGAPRPRWAWHVGKVLFEKFWLRKWF